MTTPQRQEPTAALPDSVWQLLGRADVTVRGVLAARAAERRLWAERARAWLRGVGQAWVRSG